MNPHLMCTTEISNIQIYLFDQTTWSWKVNRVENKIKYIIAKIRNVFQFTQIWVNNSKAKANAKLLLAVPHAGLLTWKLVHFINCHISIIQSSIFHISNTLRYNKHLYQLYSGAMAASLHGWQIERIVENDESINTIEWAISFTLKEGVHALLWWCHKFIHSPWFQIPIFHTNITSRTLCVGTYQSRTSGGNVRNLQLQQQQQ